MDCVMMLVFKCKKISIKRYFQCYNLFVEECIKFIFTVVSLNIYHKVNSKYP